MSLFTRATRAGLLNNMDRGKGCVAYDPTVAPSFDYIPSLAPGIVFSVFFALSLIAHILQTSISRRWWFSTFAIGALGKENRFLRPHLHPRSLTSFRRTHGLDRTSGRAQMCLQQDCVYTSDLHPHHL